MSVLSKLTKKVSLSDALFPSKISFDVLGDAMSPDIPDDAAKAEAKRLAEQRAAVSRINDLFGVGTSTTATDNAAAREGIYGTLRQDTLDYLLNDVNDQRGDIERQKRFTLARSGLGGGSADIDLSANILDDYNKAVLNAGNKADSSATGLRQSDEQARLNLINAIYGGMDEASAVASATNQLKTNADSAETQALTSGAGSAFDSIAEILRANAYRQGLVTTPGATPTGSSSYYSIPAYSGSIYRG